MPAELDRDSDNIAQFAPRYTVELCGCGHALDHRGKPCGHPAMVPESDGNGGFTLVEGTCGCKNGVRTDVVTVRMLQILVNKMSELGAQLHDLATITLFANGLEIDAEGQIVRKSGIVKV